MKTISMAACLGLMILIGCSQSQVGTVQPPKEIYLGYHVPDVPVARPDGRFTTFNKMRLDVTIVAFTTNEGRGVAESVLVDLANGLKFVDLPVDVVQIVPAESRKSPSGWILEKESSPARYLTVLRDPSGIASCAYLNPKPGEVFLLDWNSQVVAKGTVENLGDIPRLAERLGQTMYQFYLPSTWGF
ncbi:MAG: hypothetical protein WC869_03230 [Phycisphaerae bacterium]|jgi:hypothetical protein